jgi:hypothetical protein
MQEVTEEGQVKAALDRAIEDREEGLVLKWADSLYYTASRRLVYTFIDLSL